MADALVVGGGQAGLAAGYHLKRAGLSFAILEAGEELGGSWREYYDSLRLFSRARNLGPAHGSSRCCGLRFS